MSIPVASGDGHSPLVSRLFVPGAEILLSVEKAAKRSRRFRSSSADPLSSCLHGLLTDSIDVFRPTQLKGIGESRESVIDDVEVRDLRMDADERGHLVESVREARKLYDAAPAMRSTRCPTRRRARGTATTAGRSTASSVRTAVDAGVYDDREPSSTRCRYSWIASRNSTYRPRLC
jgi:hypothetical protein